MPPGGVFAVPQQIAVLIGHFSWDANLVAVKSSGFAGGFHRLRVSNRGLGPRGVAVGIGVDIGISAGPNESGFLFEVV